MFRSLVFNFFSASLISSCISSSIFFSACALDVCTLWSSVSVFYLVSGEFLRMSSPNISAHCICSEPHDSSSCWFSLSPCFCSSSYCWTWGCCFCPLARPFTLPYSPFSSPSMFSYFEMMRLRSSELSRSNEFEASLIYSFLLAILALIKGL